jgi:hypothetical protein
VPILNLQKAYPLEGFVDGTLPDPEIVGLVKARNVVSGLKIVEMLKTFDIETVLLAAQVSTSDPRANPISRSADWIWNLMDAVGDIAISEGMFHVIQGNPVKGGAVPEAISKGKLVANPDVVDSVKSGLEVGQRFSLHFSTNDIFTLPNGWGNLPGTSRRMRAEPYLNKWLCSLLPSPSIIKCEIIVNDSISHTATAENIGLQAIDLMYLVGEDMKDDDSMLSLAIKKYIRTSYGYSGSASLKIVYHPSVSGGQFSFAEIHPVFLYARRIITAARPLDTHDYMLPQDAGDVLKLYNKNELKDRLDEARSSLITAVNNLNSAIAIIPFNHTAVTNALYELSRFGLEQTVYEFENDTNPDDETLLRAWSSSVLALAQTRINSSYPIAMPGTGTDAVPYINSVATCMKSLFGNAFVTIPLFQIRTQELSYLSPMVGGSSTLKQDHSGNKLLMEEWLSSIARVRKNTSDYTMLTNLVNAIDFSRLLSFPLIPMQMPYINDGSERWLGASVANTVALREGRIAIGACLPVAHDLAGDQAGILIEEWTDVIPNRDQTSGISFHHNQPNAKAPQCLILGLTPSITGNWSWQDLVDMMNETFELAKKRAIDYERLSGSAVGQLPGIAIPFTQGGNAIGLSAAHILSVNP